MLPRLTSCLHASIHHTSVFVCLCLCPCSCSPKPQTPNPKPFAQMAAGAACTSVGAQGVLTRGPLGQGRAAARGSPRKSVRAGCRGGACNSSLHVDSTLLLCSSMLAFIARLLRLLHVSSPWSLTPHPDPSLSTLDPRTRPLNVQR